MANRCKNISETLIRGPPAKPLTENTISTVCCLSESANWRRSEFTQSSIFLCFVSFVATKEMKIDISKVNEFANSL